jgi:hypothetical protein
MREIETMHRHKQQLSAASLAWAMVVILFWANLLCAQTTSFTYQGRLTDGGNAASGSYDLQFALFDGSSGGTQIGSTLTRSAVAVSGGVFSLQLDFGVTAFPGADRFLEIGVRLSGGGSFTVLSPRQQISSTPYAIRTLSATQADALSSACAACVQDSQINSVAGSKVTGAIPVTSVPSGSTSYIQNTSSQQSSANFNISGSGTLGGNLLTGGRIGVGPLSPLHRLGISGGPAWTGDFWGGAIDLENASAIGWRGNSSGFRFGIGHTNAGLAFFRTGNDLGTTGVAPSYDFLINNSGNIAIGSPSLTPTLTSKVEIFAQDGLRINGFQPFLTLNDTNGGNKQSFVQAVNGDAVLLTNSRAALTVKDVSGDITINGHATQPIGNGGFVKAMVLVNADGSINLCYNSQLTGSAATTPPCGLSVNTPFGDVYDITFPFQVNVRFLSATTAYECCGNIINSGSPAQIGARPISPQTIRVQVKFEGRVGVSIPFYLIVF